VPALSIIAISPAAPNEAFREPALAIAASRAGAIGILDLEYVSTEAWAQAYEKLAKHAKSGPIGIRCRSGQMGDLSQLTENQSTRCGHGQFLILTASAGRFELNQIKKRCRRGQTGGLHGRG
jgi:hypothetical protein